MNMSLQEIRQVQHRHVSSAPAVVAADDPRGRLDRVLNGGPQGHGGVSRADGGEEVRSAHAAARVALRKLGEARRVIRIGLEADHADLVPPLVGIGAKIAFEFVTDEIAALIICIRSKFERFLIQPGFEDSP